MTLEVDIVTPAAKMASQDAKMAIVPGVEGEFGVLTGHAPVTSMLRAGVVQLFDEFDKVRGRFFVAGGFAETDGKHCIILADEAVNLDQFTKQDAIDRLEKAKADFAEASESSEQMVAEKELKTAEILLESIE